mmetsp:Transcript_21796/g.19856  ORF Transcript_21796/g.19856 Transcript_21796/m.19856 type:complete len:221 (-) Transcript_21796:53-715(-)
MIINCYTIIFLILFVFSYTSCYKLNNKITINHSLNKLSSNSIKQNKQLKQFILYGQIAKKDDEVETKENLVSIPYEGIIGGERGSLFKHPIDVYDPMKDTSDLPGEDGSDEKIAAIMKRIEERVQTMKQTGDWDEGDTFGKNPLANQSLIDTMISQIKTCKPFESFDELALTYLLMLGTTVFLSTYLLTMRDLSNNFMLWFTGSDLDSEFMNTVMRNISA